jgi:hypothetical protein
VGSTLNNYLKSAGKFKDVLELNGNPDDDDESGDGGGGDICCDDGIDKPVWDKKDDPGVECYLFWYQCGFLPEIRKPGLYDEEIKHRRLLNFTPLMRITDGTNIVSISGSEHARRCHPVKRREGKGIIDDDSFDFCQPPSTPSKRSYTISEKIE